MQAVESKAIRKLSDVAFEAPDLVERWMRFVVMCPALATRVDTFEVVDTPEAVRRTGRSDWLGRQGPGGLRSPSGPRQDEARMLPEAQLAAASGTSGHRGPPSNGTSGLTRSHLPQG